MYIRVTKIQRGHAYYHLVESYRQEGKVKQRVLLSLGRVEENKLEELAEAINKHLETASIFNLAREINIEKTFILGPLLVLERMMDQLGIPEVLRKLSGDHKKLQFDFQKVIFTPEIPLKARRSVALWRRSKRSSSPIATTRSMSR